MRIIILQGQVKQSRINPERHFFSITLRVSQTLLKCIGCSIACKSILGTLHGILRSIHLCIWDERWQIHIYIYITLSNMWLLVVYVLVFWAYAGRTGPENYLLVHLLIPRLHDHGYHVILIESYIKYLDYLDQKQANQSTFLQILIRYFN